MSLNLEVIDTSYIPDNIQRVSTSKTSGYINVRTIPITPKLRKTCTNKSLHQHS